MWEGWCDHMHAWFCGCGQTCYGSLGRSTSQETAIIEGYNYSHNIMRHHLQRHALKYNII